MGPHGRARACYAAFGLTLPTAWAIAFADAFAEALASPIAVPTPLALLPPAPFDLPSAVVALTFDTRRHSPADSPAGDSPPPAE